MTTQDVGISPHRLKELAQARDDLAAIRNLTAALPDEAQERGSTASEALHLATPTADPDAWHQRLNNGWTPDPYATIGAHHPRWVLGTWDRHIRLHNSHGLRTQPAAVDTAAAYIDQHLSDLAASPTFPFTGFAGALAACRAHLEAVLRDGEQIESGAPCMTCHQPIRKDTTDPDNPAYRCTTCRRDLTANEYRLAVAAAHLKHADRLPVEDLAERIDVAPSSIRRWANVVRIQKPGEDPIVIPALLRSCGRTETSDGRKLKVYRVAEALRIKHEGDHRRSHQGETDATKDPA